MLPAVPALLLTHTHGCTHTPALVRCAGIAANSQVLMMDGKRLRNTRKISEYQLQDGSTVALVQRQPGMVHPFNRRALH